ncbi:hypothetical protein HPB51_001302 [Rhipicephalus microplus]|uniref:Uncharacterized protein n=1 Tax=Rhipicephalus microplus TaxID=6941 RepID=A0A9J6D3R0_RHIMP|nr:hypothetical protein HPB51_001302 [Rhipicephalus microplus]
MTATRPYRFNGAMAAPLSSFREALSARPRVLYPALDFRSTTLLVGGYALQGPRLQASALRLIPSNNDSVRLLLPRLCGRPRRCACFVLDHTPSTFPHVTTFIKSTVTSSLLSVGSVARSLTPTHGALLFFAQLCSPPKHAPSDDDFSEISSSELTEVVGSIPPVTPGPDEIRTATRREPPELVLWRATAFVAPVVQLAGGAVSGCDWSASRRRHSKNQGSWTSLCNGSGTRARAVLEVPGVLAGTISFPHEWERRQHLDGVLFYTSGFNRVQGSGEGRSGVNSRHFTSPLS